MLILILLPSLSFSSSPLFPQAIFAKTGGSKPLNGKLLPCKSRKRLSIWHAAGGRCFIRISPVRTSGLPQDFTVRRSKKGYVERFSKRRNCEAKGSLDYGKQSTRTFPVVGHCACLARRRRKRKRKRKGFPFWPITGWEGRHMLEVRAALLARIRSHHKSVAMFICVA